MPRRWFLLLLVCFALIEAGLLFHGWRSQKNPLLPAPHARGPQAGGLPQALTSPTLYVEPEAGFNWVYAQVASAQSTIDLVMYELVDTTFTADLVQACQRGVQVRVILDQNLEKTANTPAYNQLSAAGSHCQVVWAHPQFQASHEKSMVIDETRAVVMSFNLTSRYYPETRDMGLLDTDPLDVTGIRLAFAQDFAAVTSNPAPPLAGHNLIWSPTTAQDDLVSLIESAKATLLVENEELGAPVIVTALAAACRRGVQVQLAMTDTSAAYHANFLALQAAGCGVHVDADDADTLYIHAKAMVIDLGTPQAIGYLGSINFSTASMTKNRELGLYVHDATVLQAMATAMSGDYAMFPAYSGASAGSGSGRALP